MKHRIRNTVISLAALAALALGGSVFAQAQSGSSTPASPPSAESTTGPDTDTVQSGDQSGPDNGKADKGEKADTETKDPAAEAPDSASDPADSGTEASGTESAPGSDGPGGHADETGSATTAGGQ